MQKQVKDLKPGDKFSGKVVQRIEISIAFKGMYYVHYTNHTGRLTPGNKPITTY